MTPTDGIHKRMNILKVKDIYECNVLLFVNNIMMKICPRSFELYFQKIHNNYDVRRKNQLVVPLVRLCLGEEAVRVTGASLWNRLHKDMVQYRFMKCFKGKLKNNYISKYHMWCIDMWSCDIINPRYEIWYHIVLFQLEKTIVLVAMSDPCCPSYSSIFFCLVVSKMSFALLWQPPTDNITCIMISCDMCIVYLLENKIKLLLL